MDKTHNISALKYENDITQETNQFVLISKIRSVFLCDKNIHNVLCCCVGMPLTNALTHRGLSLYRKSLDC